MTGSRPAGLSTADTTRTRRTRVTRSGSRGQPGRPQPSRPVGHHPTPCSGREPQRRGQDLWRDGRIREGRRHAAATRTSVQPQRTRDRTGRPARVCRSGRRPRPSRQLIGGRDLRCPRQDSTCPRRRSAVPQLPDTARSGRTADTAVDHLAQLGRLGLCFTSGGRSIRRSLPRYNSRGLWVNGEAPAQRGFVSRQQGPC
jgi:hypothetical protein